MPIHVPDLGFAGGAVVPDDVGLAVPIHVSQADDAEWRSDEGGLAIRSKHSSPVNEPMPLHVPDLGFAGGAVVPKDGGLPVPVHVSRPNDAEWRSDEGRLAIRSEHSSPVDELVSVHVPDLGFAGGAVVPKDAALFHNASPLLSESRRTLPRTPVFGVFRLCSSVERAVSKVLANFGVA
jgi:hypothetical protein